MGHLWNFWRHYQLSKHVDYLENELLYPCQILYIMLLKILVTGAIWQQRHSKVLLSIWTRITWYTKPCLGVWHPVVKAEHWKFPRSVGNTLPIDISYMPFKPAEYCFSSPSLQFFHSPRGNPLAYNPFKSNSYHVKVKKNNKAHPREAS